MILRGRTLRPATFLGGAALLGALACASASSKRAAPKAAPPAAASCENGRELHPISGSLEAVLAQEDTDSDCRITVLDKGKKRFSLSLEGGGSYRVEGTYQLANLVQELFLASVDGRSTILSTHIDEPIAERISRLIRERYWDNLTRRIDEQSLESVLADPKTDPARTKKSADWPESCTPAPAGLPQFLYVPHEDARALEYYASMRAAHPNLVVCRLPQVITPEWVRDLSANEEHGSRHGLLSLALEEKQGALAPLPYGVPGGRFNEMYGWDSYFHLRGLLEDGKNELAAALVENQLYEVRHYKMVLNANRTYYLTRSQPPFLSSSVRALWESGQKDEEWLTGAVATLISEYDNVWNSGDRVTPLCRPVAESKESAQNSVCLATYHAAGLGEPPEVEPGHFDWLYKQRAPAGQEPKEYGQKYRKRELPESELESLDWFFTHDRSMRESGHDTTYRWHTEEGDACADFATVDLNALLFKYELDLAQLEKALHHPGFERWCDRARARRALVQEYLYDGELFVDYRLDRDATRNFTGTGQKSKYVSATTLYPLWAGAQSPCQDEEGNPLRLVSGEEQAARLVSAALPQLEAPGGLAATARASRAGAEQQVARQWDYPFGWAPHQVLAWEGLRQSAHQKEAERLTYRWLYMIARNAHDFHGTVPEKFDVVRRSHQVFAEYGNVGTAFSYITREGFGWMNASFQLGLSALSADLRSQLNRLVPPEQLAAFQH